MVKFEQKHSQKEVLQNLIQFRNLIIRICLLFIDEYFFEEFKRSDDPMK
jgi:hypothetical protein